MAHTEVYHGVSVKDSYQWLEELSSSRVKLWSQRQDSILHNYLAASPIKKQIKDRLSELVSLDLYSTPIMREGQFYYSKNSAKDEIPKIYNLPAKGAQEKLLINPTSTDSGLKLMMNGSTSGFSISEKGTWLAYNLSKGNQRWFQVDLFNLKTKIHKETIKGFHVLGGGPIWYKDEGFFYNHYDEPEDNEKLTAEIGNASIYYHQAGTTQVHDKLILANDFLGEGWLYSFSISGDNLNLIVSAQKGSSPFNRIFIKRIGSDEAFKELFINNKARYTFLGNDLSDFFFYTDSNAPNGQIIKTSLVDNKTSVVIPESDQVMSGNSLVGGNALGYFNNKFVIKYTSSGEVQIKVFNKEGKHLFTPLLPLGGSIWGGLKGEKDSDKVYYQYLGLIDPSSIYSLDLNTGEVEIFRRSISLNENDFIVEKVMVPNGKDIEIPMYIARKKSTQIDSTNPGFIYGYGAFGWVSFIWYQPHILLWLEMGGVYAIPGIRGGGELGSRWHISGSGKNKQNSIDDYIAASKWLIDSGYVAKDKLVANGGSISAVVAGAALNQQPDLYKAAVIDRPALDLLRFPKFTGAKAWIEELGSPEKKFEFEALYKYSPYHNIEKKCYPPTLVMVGDEDETTPPLHAFKYVASLQDKNTCLTNPVLLKIMKGVGHNFGTRYLQKVDSFTDMMYFLYKNVMVD
ncbi:MAG: prolyl oligopeptidase family serine peptidase [Bacteroidota bacterium]